jgi:hypothetical protein
MKRALSAALASLLCSCATYQAYEGPSRSSSELAIIEGSAKLRSELPLALVIRSVDGREVDLRYSSVAVEPGKHQLIVDCQVGGSAGTASRHAVVIEVSAGTRYRLNAQMSPGNRSCAGVELEAR